MHFSYVPGGKYNSRNYSQQSRKQRQKAAVVEHVNAMVKYATVYPYNRKLCKSFKKG